MILASASPRRCELLTQAGLTFEVHAAHIDESRLPYEAPSTYVHRLALEKARAVHALFPAATVIGADTTVVFENEILNKPTGIADAERMLRTLSGRIHQVYTGIAVVTPTAQRVHLETTHVTFSEISEDDLARYLASGDPLDKAGAYGIQGFAARWIPRIEGDYFNVVGLPIAATMQLLTELAPGEI
ncbi:MAG TPA: nucleoside triphosphate pyrophosphatase [Acidobacteriaceae bacterium]|nr:nucleoside triphosphate pyrophosphatase [Acidobacteriaceae bacterium]